MGDHIAELGAAVRRVITDPAAMEGYRRDQCLIAEAGTPAAVVLAEGVEDVVATIEIARDAAVPVVTRGAGTGLAGGANALDGSIVLSVARMDRVLDLDPLARTARVEPGVLNGALDAQARRHGLWYAPDPGSREICTIGGNIATNAGGMCCAKYGVTADHVRSLEAVIGTGERLATGRNLRKNVAGLDLVRLFVGSEGTLGVVVEATVALRPEPPRVATVVATFPTVQAAVATVLELGGAIEPRAVEIMDAVTIAAVNAHTGMGIDPAAGAVLLAQFDTRDAGAEAADFARVARAHGAEAFDTADEDEGAALMAARRMALPALERLGATLLDDIGVPVHRLPEMLLAVDRIATAHDVVVGTFGHLADGNLHPTVVFDAADPLARSKAAAAFGDILQAALDLDGTMTGEHGVGCLKQAQVAGQLSTLERRLMGEVKRAFDPVGILNPGRGF